MLGCRPGAEHIAIAGGDVAKDRPTTVAVINTRVVVPRELADCPPRNAALAARLDDVPVSAQVCDDARVQGWALRCIVAVEFVRARPDAVVTTSRARNQVDHLAQELALPIREARHQAVADPPTRDGQRT